MKMSRVTKGSGIFHVSNAVRAAQVSTDCKIIFCVCSSLGVKKWMQLKLSESAWQLSKFLRGKIKYCIIYFG